jgi:hypothetical protein
LSDPRPTALVDFYARTSGGRALAVIDIKDNMAGYQIPLGAAAQVAILPSTGTTSR